MIKHLASSVLFPLALALLLPGLGWSKPAPAATSSSSIEPEFHETMLNLKHATVIGDFYVRPGRYVATVNEGYMKLHNLNQGIVAEVVIARQEANHTFMKNKVDVKGRDLKKLDLGGTNEAAVIRNPGIAAS